MFKVNWCKWDKIVNEHFIPILDNKDRYVIMYGGRGSSKSNFEAKKLIYRCLTEDYFRHILIRNTYAVFRLWVISLFSGYLYSPFKTECLTS